LDAFGGDGPEVALFVAKGVLQQDGVFVYHLLLNLSQGEGLGIFEVGVGGVGGAQAGGEVLELGDEGIALLVEGGGLGGGVVAAQEDDALLL
jgi:hypothetical protein